MRKLFPKIVIYPVFLSIAAVMTGACIAEPVDLVTFLEDEKVVEIIEKAKEKVILHAGSESYLEAGTGKITGLKNDKYYVIEEFQENGVSKSIKFVIENGMQSAGLGEIAKVTGKEILYLSNSVVYKVNEAKPLHASAANLIYFELVSGNLPAAAGGSAQAVNGKISVPAPNGQGDPPGYYLNAGININKKFEIMALDASPSSSSRPWGLKSRTSAFIANGALTSIIDANYTKYEQSLSPGIYQHRGTITPSYLTGTSLIPLRGENTVTDYIIAEYDDAGALANFNVLTVSVLEKPGFTINLTYDDTNNNSPVVTASSSSYNQSQGNYTITFTVQNPANYSNYQWYVDGAAVSGAVNNAFIMDFSLINYKILGTYYIMVEAQYNSVRYSTTVQVTVNP